MKLELEAKHQSGVSHEDLNPHYTLVLVHEGQRIPIGKAFGVEAKWKTVVSDGRLCAAGEHRIPDGIAFHAILETDDGTVAMDVRCKTITMRSLPVNSCAAPVPS